MFGKSEQCGEVHCIDGWRWTDDIRVSVIGDVKTEWPPLCYICTISRSRDTSPGTHRSFHYHIAAHQPAQSHPN